MGDKFPLSQLLRELADAIDEKPQGALPWAVRFCAILERFVNASSRIESVSLLAAAASALEAVDMTYKNQRSDTSVTDAGGPIPAVEPRRRK